MSIFNEENSIYKTLFNSSTKDCSKDILNEVIKLNIAANDRTVDLDVFNILNILGIDKFCELVQYLNGRAVKLPKVKQWSSTLISSIAWYYYSVEGKSISETKKIISNALGMDNNNLRERRIRLSVLEIDSKINELSETIRRLKAREEDGE